MGDKAAALSMRSRRPVNRDPRKSEQELSQAFIVSILSVLDFIFKTEVWQDVDKSSLFSEAFPLDCTYCEPQRTTRGNQ